MTELLPGRDVPPSSGDERGRENCWNIRCSFRQTSRSPQSALSGLFLLFLRVLENCPIRIGDPSIFSAGPSVDFLDDSQLRCAPLFSGERSASGISSRVGFSSSCSDVSFQFDTRKLEQLDGLLQPRHNQLLAQFEILLQPIRLPAFLTSA